MTASKPITSFFMASSLVLHIAARTDTGLARAHNEDAIAVDAENGIVALADGMGGYNAGEVASRLAVDGVTRYLVAQLQGSGERFFSNPLPLSQIVTAAVASANDEILHTARTQPQLSGMGTTLVAAVFYQDRLVLTHLGDSRCYRLRNGTLTQLTHDHSQVQEQVDAGLLPADWARHAPHKNLITRALGVAEQIEVDIAEHALAKNDLYLFCSDGLSDMLTDATLAGMLQSDDGDLDLLAAALIQAANLEGGRDNISAVLVRVADCGAVPELGLMEKLKVWIQR